MNARPLVLGVVGKCCAGKDFVADWLVERGWQPIDVDAIGHRALAARHTELVAAFGMTILAASGTIDRRRLGEIVFGDRKQLARLEEIVHPWMRDRVRDEAEAFRDAVERGEKDLPAGLVINAALLFHMSLDQYCDRVILVEAPLLARVIRARRRDNYPWRQIIDRLRSQTRIDAQAHESTADIINVKNGKRPTDLFMQLEAIPEIGSGVTTRYGAE